MTQHFNFDETDKHLPYTVPENFFDEMEKNIMDNIQDTSAPQNSYRRIHFPKTLSIAASLILAFFVGIHFIEIPQQKNSDSQIPSCETQMQEEQIFNQLSAQDQEYFIETYHDDIFINEFVQ